MTIPLHVPDEQTPAQRYLRPRAAARYVSMSERHLWSQTHPRGPIPRIRLGRSVCYDIRDLDAFMNRAKEGGKQ
jgi:hypothetical protein